MDTPDRTVPAADLHIAPNIDRGKYKVVRDKKEALLQQLKNDRHDLREWLALLGKPEYAPIVTGFKYNEDNEEVRFENTGCWTMHKFPPEMRAMAEFLESKNFSQLELVNTGDKCLVLACDAEFAQPPHVRPVVIRIRHQDSEPIPRPKQPFILQPYAEACVGNLLYVEVLPRVNTQDVTSGDVEKLENAAQNCGLKWGDSHDYNAGLMSNGLSVVTDSGNIFVDPQCHHVDVEFMKPWTNGKWTQCVLYPGVLEGWDQIKGQYHSLPSNILESSASLGSAVVQKTSTHR